MSAFTLRPDGRIHLAPIGEYPHGDYLQRLTRESLEALVARWRANGARELLIDFDHASRRDPDERDSQAAGWVSDLQVDAEGLWGLPRWSDAGLAAVANGRFRYCSPVFGYPRAPATAGEPVAISEVALTNKPNLPVREIANAAPAPADTANSQLPTPNSTPKPMDLTALATALGLPPESTAEQILSAINALKAEKDALATECDNARCAKATEVANSLGLTGDKAKPFVILYKKDPEAAMQLANSLPKPEPKPAVTARHPAGTPAVEIANGSPGDLSARRDALVARIRSERGLSHARAWDLARSESPELFR